MNFLDCDAAEALRTGLEAAGGKNCEVLSPTIDNPGGTPVRLHLLNGGDHAGAVNVRCRPVR